jgi:hypothetical protein
MPSRDDLSIKMRMAPVLAVLGATACMPAEAAAIELSCTVEGAKNIGTSEQVCSAFRQKIDASMPARTKSVIAFSDTGRADAIDVDIRILKRGGIVAYVKQRKNGAVHSFPEIAIDVMDRPLSLPDVEVLAGEVAKLIS